MNYEETGAWKYYQLVDYIPGVLPRDHHKYLARSSGEYRPPKKGEWYLSGAIIEAYRALDDLTQSQFIATIVRVEREMHIREVEVLHEGVRYRP